MSEPEDDESHCVTYNGFTFRKFRDRLHPNFEELKLGDKIIWPQGFTRSDWMRELQEFKAREDDVYVCSYPKSGRNWASLFVPMIMAGKVSDITTMPALNALDCQSPSTFIKLPSPRLIQNHLPVDLTPSDIFRKKCKILLICRNPKDVITSFYHHSLVLRDMYHVEGEPPFSDYFEISIQGKVDFDGWFDHTLGWWQQVKDSDHILLVKYEDLIKDCPGTIKAIAQFLNRPLDDTTCEAIAHATHFKRTAPTFKEIWTRAGNDSMAKLYRKGKVGDWKNHFTVAQNERYDKTYAEKMDGTGLNLDFELPDN